MSQILLIRPKPLPGELLSSWLVRLAFAHHCKLETFTRYVLGVRWRLWFRNMERSIPEEVLAHIALTTGITQERAWETTFLPLEGVLFEDCRRHGIVNWLLAEGNRSRTLHLPGMQFCPSCLAEDEIPYYRISWRLAYSTVCLKHSVKLIDRCPSCTGVISYHQGDYGFRKLQSGVPWVHCPRCGMDWRTCAPVRIDDGDVVLWLTRFLERAITEGWAKIGLRTVMAYPALSGIRYLLRIISSNGFLKAMRTGVAGELGRLPFAMDFSNGRGNFESLEVAERHRALGYVGYLLEEWPLRFVEVAEKSKMRRSYIDDYRTQIPFWLQVELDWQLGRSFYHPSIGERASVISYLQKYGMSTSENNVRRWLGLSHTKNHCSARGIL